MSIAHKQMEAFNYTNETFKINGGKIQEVSFSPIVYSFFPERSKRENMVEIMVAEIQWYYENYCECCEPKQQSFFVFNFEKETLEFEYAFDYLNNKQLFIVDVNASRCFGHGVNETIH